MAAYVEDARFVTSQIVLLVIKYKFIKKGAHFMKKLLSFLMILAITFTCISCSSKTTAASSGAGLNSEHAGNIESTDQNQAADVELIVFAAASMTETMTEIKVRIKIFI